MATKVQCYRYYYTRREESLNKADVTPGNAIEVWVPYLFGIIFLCRSYSPIIQSFFSLFHQWLQLLEGSYCIVQQGVTS